MADAKDLFEQVKQQASQGGDVDLNAVAKGFRQKMEASIGGLAKDIAKGTINLGPEFMKAVNTGTAEGFANFSKTILTTLKDAAEKGSTAAAAVLKTVFDGMMMVFIKANKMWSEMNTSLEGAMKSLTRNAVELVTGKNSLVGKAVGGFMDNVISAMMFRYEEGLAYRKTKTFMEAQVGTGSPEATKGASEAMSYSWALTRNVAMEWGTALAKVGFINEKNVLPGMIRVGMQLGLNSGESAKLLDSFRNLTSSTTEAVGEIETLYRKLQVAGRDASLPAKQMGEWVKDAGIQARFLNVDVKTLGNTMVFIANKANEFAKFGVGRDKLGGVLRELATGGKGGISDELHMYFGSDRGKEDIGMKAWVKSAFGTGIAESLQETGGGGFTTGASQADILAGGGDMMTQRLKMMKETMLDAAKGAATPHEKLFMQIKTAKDMFGMSEDAARALALTGQEDLKKIADNPKLADKFKDTNTLLGNLREVASKSENIQRALSGVALSQLQVAIKTGLFTQAIAMAQVGEDKEGAKKITEAFKGDMGTQISSMGTQLGVVFKEMKGVLSPGEKDMMGKFFSQLNELASKSSEGKFGVSNPFKAEGGLISGPAIVGEKGPELFVPSTSGTIIANNKLGGLGGGNVTMNVSIQGATLAQIKENLIKEVERNLG